VNLATMAQIIAAASNLILAAVVVVAYYLFVKIYRATLEEMRAARVAGGRPQVIVEAGYDRLPLVDVVVRNVGGGTAKDIEFDFSCPMVNSTGFVLSDLNYFKIGMSLLGAGEEVRSLWDTFNDLVPVLREKGLEEGITVRVRYRDLAGEDYEDEWTINPLRYEGETLVGGYKGINDLVEVVEKISADVETLVRSQAEARGNGNESPKT
jgi:hypothetical protein